MRNRLQQRGIIAGQEVAIEAVDASGNRHMLHLAAGARIRFLIRNDTLGVINETEARVVAVETGQDSAIRISAEKDGQPLVFSLADVADTRGRARIASALAATTFAAKSMSVTRHLVWMSGRFQRHDAYVAASRARETTEFFVDHRALDREIEQAGPRTANLEIDERMAHLAARLSRATVETNALDLIAAEKNALARRGSLPVSCERARAGGGAAGHGRGLRFDVGSLCG